MYFLKNVTYVPTRTFWFICCHSYPSGKVTFVSHAYFNYYYYNLDSIRISANIMPCLYLKRHERAVTNVLFCCRHSVHFGRAYFVTHTYFS